MRNAIVRRWTLPKLGLVAILTLVSISMSATATPAASPAATGMQHCLVKLAPLTPEDQAAHRGSRVISKQCSAQPIVQPNNGPALVQLFEGAGYSGNSVTFFGSNCLDSYGVPDLSTIGWANRVVSAVRYCERNSVLYQGTYGSGAQYAITTDVPDMGQFDDTANSWATA